MTVDQMREAAAKIKKKYSDAELVRNTVGNLTIMVRGIYVGYVDVLNGTVEWNEGEGSI